LREHAAGTGPLVVVEDRGAVRWFTLNRPERLNAFTGAMREELAEALEATAASRAVRGMVITGAGRGFSAGADVDAMIELLERGDEAGFRRNVEAGMRVIRALAGAPQPVIAAVNGVAVGAGAALACACDLRLASEEARIGFTFNRIGLHPDWGATYFLPRIVGSARARELILTARVLHSADAQALGLVDLVLPPGGFLESVSERADEMATRAPLALAELRRSLLDVEALERALAREAEAQLACFRSDDVREGISAFREKRSPHFSGR
jgi:enoyl-CoA hydratase/carnithine racemase